MHTTSSGAYRQGRTASSSAHWSSRCFRLILGIFATMLVASAGATQSGPDRERFLDLSAAPPTPRPALVSPPAREWPFGAWSYAKAYTFNFFPARHGVQLRVFENGNWNQHINSEVVVGREHALSVARLVNSTKGSFETSKCPFPRHAFVFFNDKDEPVASVDVCFECDDLFAWPDFEIREDAKYGTYVEMDVGDLEDTRPPVGPRGGLWTEFRSALVEYKKILLQVGLPLNWQ